MTLSLGYEHIKKVILEKPSEPQQLARHLGQFALNDQNDRLRVAEALGLQAQLLQQLSGAAEPDEPFSFTIGYSPAATIEDIDFTSSVFISAVRDAVHRGADIEVRRRSATAAS
jgi:hypothetical protein